MKKLICPGSLELLKNSKRKAVSKQGMDVTNWLYQQGLDSNRKKRDVIERTL